ncbi:hypothetical protein NFI96_027245, partial [Prochilodus magdalenae]
HVAVVSLGKTPEPEGTCTVGKHQNNSTIRARLHGFLGLLRTMLASRIGMMFTYSKYIESLQVICERPCLWQKLVLQKDQKHQGGCL